MKQVEQRMFRDDKGELTSLTGALICESSRCTMPQERWPTTQHTSGAELHGRRFHRPLSRERQQQKAPAWPHTSPSIQCIRQRDGVCTLGRERKCDPQIISSSGLLFMSKGNRGGRRTHSHEPLRESQGPSLPPAGPSHWRRRRASRHYRCWWELWELSTEVGAGQN